MPRKDLRLMVKGLIAGIWTLSLAFVLLFAVLYVIAGFATMILGHSNDLRGISEDLPSMLWAQGLPGVIGRVVLESRFQFDELRSATERCESFVEARSWTRLTGRRSFVMLLVHVGACADCLLNECVTKNGESITSILAEKYGVSFVLSFVVSYMLVTMGIFNVILAVYVDITMKAAKENESLNAEQYSRECCGFAAANHQFNETEDHHVDFTSLNHASYSSLLTDDELHEDIAINKELFLIMLQDSHPMLSPPKRL
eukprot:s164_g21.t1